MYPALRALDVCVSRKISCSRLKAGDIVVYNSGGVLAVHRVLSVDKDRTCALVKGDNIPYRFCEKVLFSDIKDKVVSVKRGEKVFDLEGFPRRHTGRFLAFLFRHDLTPRLLKTRLVDPFLPALSGNPFYVFFRKLSYKDIFFMRRKDKAKCHVHAFVRGTESARAVLELTEGRGISVRSYIRFRDRNPLFADKFIHKVIEVADKEYGPQHDIYVTDQGLEKLLRSKDGESFPGRIRFT